MFKIVIFVTALTFPWLHQDQDNNPKSYEIKQLSWLVGSWSSSKGDAETDEHWIEPKGGMMLGLNRTTRGEKASFEYMRLQQENGTIIFYASPSGQSAVPFKLKSLGENTVVFENVKNDFPQRIYYHRKQDRLHAAIEGNIKGEPKRIEWNWKLQN